MKTDRMIKYYVSGAVLCSVALAGFGAAIMLIILILLIIVVIIV